jgi:hypothetical protein
LAFDFEEEVAVGFREEVADEVVAFADGLNSRGQCTSIEYLRS